MVSHMLRMQKVLGSSPSVSNFEKTNICFPSFPFPTLPHSGVFQHVCPMARSRRVAAPTEKHWSRPANLQCWRCPWGGGREASLNLYGRSLNAFPSNQPQPLGNYHQHFLQHAHLGTLPKVETVARYFVCGRLRNAPTVGLEPTTTRLRALCSTD